jgi:hypothetical protein
LGEASAKAKLSRNEAQVQKARTSTGPAPRYSFDGNAPTEKTGAFPHISELLSR